ncbi:MAG: hypothetical protein HQ454_04345 [Acidimicrobiaceae bacterium]|nr:hypothetical protein [Acidimicrobiaceae bacterium]
MILQRLTHISGICLCVAALTIGCATEVVELDSATASTNVQSQDEPVYEVPANATLGELAVILRDEMGALSEAMFNADRNAARTHLAAVNIVWSLMEPLMVTEYGELADQLTYDLRRVVELARSAVDRNRPADADKAKLFLRLALDSLGVK